MRALGGWCPRAFFNVDVIEGDPKLCLPVKPNTIDKGNPDFVCIQIFDFDAVLNRTVVRTGYPLPGHAKFWRSRFTNIRNPVSLATGFAMTQVPFDRNLFSV